MLFYAVFAFAPLLYTGWLSFFRWDGLTVGTWIGLDNYSRVLSDPAIRTSFVHSLVLIIFFAVLPCVLGLVLASVVAHGRVRGVGFFRAVLFLPQTVASVVIAIAWVWMYAPQGPVNEGLRAIGLGGLARSWLGSFRFALPSLGLIGTWVTFGLCMVLFLAGIQKIPYTLYEAARVDGAGHVREFFAVTLPGLRYELQVVLVLSVIGTLGTFDEIYVMTSGGPGTATSVPAYLIWRRMFQTSQVGSAAALGLTLMLIIFAVTYGLNRLMERGAET
jgi:raffinose/stachyose/melibiose transport system permease protein